VAIVKYNRGLTFLRSLLAPPRTTAPTVIWLSGSTGTGKTRFAYDTALKYFEGDIWASSNGLQWFDGYEGQRCALFDDFRSKHVTTLPGGFAFLLRLLDRYPMRVPIKGGFVNWNPCTIFITTPDAPAVTFVHRNTHIPEDMEQLHRRITASYLFPGEIESAQALLFQTFGNSREDGPTGSSQEEKDDRSDTGSGLSQQELQDQNHSTPPAFSSPSPSSGSDLDP
jgi:hypothetical protein